MTLVEFERTAAPEEIKRPEIPKLDWPNGRPNDRPEGKWVFVPDVQSDWKPLPSRNRVMDKWAARATLTVNLRIFDMEQAFEQAVEKKVRNEFWELEEAREWYTDHPDELFLENFSLTAPLCRSDVKLEFTEGLTVEDLLIAPERRKKVPAEIPIEVRFDGYRRVTIKDLRADGYNPAYPFQGYNREGYRFSAYRTIERAKEAARDDLGEGGFYVHGEKLEVGSIVIIGLDHPLEGMILEDAEVWLENKKNQTLEIKVTHLGGSDFWNQITKDNNPWVVFDLNGKLINAFVYENSAKECQPSSFYAYVSDYETLLGTIFEVDLKTKKGISKAPADPDETTITDISLCIWNSTTQQTHPYIVFSKDGVLLTAFDTESIAKNSCKQEGKWYIKSQTCKDLIGKTFIVDPVTHLGVLKIEPDPELQMLIDEEEALKEEFDFELEITGLSQHVSTWKTDLGLVPWAKITGLGIVESGWFKGTFTLANPPTVHSPDFVAYIPAGFQTLKVGDILIANTKTRIAKLKEVKG